MAPSPEAERTRSIVQQRVSRIQQITEMRASPIGDIAKNMQLFRQLRDHRAAERGE